MPAYRSDAEAEVRTAVVARLRQMRPGARILHEVNMSERSTVRIDVLAVERAEIIAVEIKSERDGLDRLPDQLRAMRACAHHAIAALHERFCTEPENPAMRAKGWLYQPTEAGAASLVWSYPEAGSERGALYGQRRWREPDLALQVPLPPEAINLLWHAELGSLCVALNVAVPRRATRGQMMTALRWGATGAQLTRGICAALRAREVIEGDAPILSGVLA